MMINGIDSDDIELKLIDFGLSKHSKKADKKVDLSTVCGTIDFMAPEVLEGKAYDASVDLWSIGVIAFTCLTGSVPFKGADEVTKLRNILSNNFDFSEEQIEELGNDAVDFVESLMKLKPSKRATPDKALSHKWLKIEG